MNHSPSPSDRRWLRGLLFGLPFLLFASLGVSELHQTLAMPGRSFRGTPGPSTAEEHALERRLEDDVRALSETIGERNVPHYASLMRARDHIVARFTETGRTPALEAFSVSNVTVDNVVLELRGSTRPDEVIVVGAHYDSAHGTPGADDNATGVAAVLALAQTAAARSHARTIRFVAFVNEEPPYFQGPAMGSLVHAKRSQARHDRIVGMLSLEMLGYFDDRGGSQRYPFPLSVAYPSTGNFVAFVADRLSRDWLLLVLDSFRATATVPSEGAALPATTQGVGWSDHWSFWQAGYPALMVTDTSLFRNPHYHTRRDLPADLDFGRLRRTVDGLDRALNDVTTR